MKLETEDGTIDPMLSMVESDYHVETIQFPYFDNMVMVSLRDLLQRTIQLANGEEVKIAGL